MADSLQASEVKNQIKNEQVASSDLQSNRIAQQNSQKIRKYLIFTLSESLYGVPLSDVLEITEFRQCIAVPGAPAYLLGLINLRGKVISAIDLKKKISTPSISTPIKRQAIIVTESQGVTLGCVVDSISEVLAIEEERIERSLEVDVKGQRDFVEGIASFSDRSMILLIDLKKAADISELIRIKALVNKAS